MRITILILLALAAATHAFALGPDHDEPVVEEIRFTSGDFELAGHLMTPAAPGPHPAIVYVWGSGPTNAAGHVARSKTLRSFLDLGYAVFLYDKPGSGASTGELDRSRLFAQRAAILIDAVETVGAHPAVNEDAVGLYGSSQASYVVATALERGCRPAFLVAWSWPMQSSIEQSAYLVGNYLLCAGRGEDEATAAQEAFLARGRAGTYGEYAAAARLLDDLPEIRDELGWAGVAPEESFAPSDAASEYFLDPAALLAGPGRLELPLLALYAENDRQIDPVQGAEVFRRLVAGGDALSRVVEIPGADHNMILSPRGCMQDQRDRYRAAGGMTVSPDFVESVSDWLERLRDRFGGETAGYRGSSAR